MELPFYGLLMISNHFLCMMGRLCSVNRRCWIRRPPLQRSKTPTSNESTWLWVPLTRVAWDVKEQNLRQLLYQLGPVWVGLGSAWLSFMVYQHFMVYQIPKPIHTYIYIHTHTHTHVYAYIYIYIYIYVCVCVCVYIYVCIRFGIWYTIKCWYTIKLANEVIA